MASVNLLGNSIGVEQAQNFLKIKEQKGLSTLCGLSGSEKELDLSKKNLSAGCAVLLSPELEDNGALSRLDIAGNSIGGEQKEKIEQICKEKSITCVC